MRRVLGSTLYGAAAGVALTIATAATPARADVVLFDKDGWSFYTKGLVAAHYQYMFGDADPLSEHGRPVGGQLFTTDSEDPRDKTLNLSRIRTGFIGTQIGFGIGRKISDTVRGESFLAISVNDISGDRKQLVPKNVDFREAWAAIHSPYGSFKFGRMFNIFGSASAPIVLLAYRYGIGNPCVATSNTIACASVGAGPLFAGFQAQFRYISPRVLGFELQFAVSDPVVTGPTYYMTRLPRFDGELNFEQPLWSSAKLKITGQTMTERLQRITEVTREMQSATIWGAMGAGVFEWGGFSLGGAGWAGRGISNRNVVESPEAAQPLAYEPSTGTLRDGRGFFGNAAYQFPFGFAIAAGGGVYFLKPTEHDLEANAGYTLLKKSQEAHVTLTQKIDALVLSAEFMQWRDEWTYGEKQTMNFTGVGANFVW